MINNLTQNKIALFGSLFYSILCLNSCSSSGLVFDNLTQLSYNYQIDSIRVSHVLSSANNIEGLLSLIVTKNNESVLSAYFNDNHEGFLNNTQSITKSVLSLLIGAAVQEGLIESEEQSIGRYLNYDKKLVEEVSIKNLLEMTSGIEWNENKDFVPWLNANSQKEFILNRATDRQPGERFEYNSGAAHMLSIILEEASGLNTQEFAVYNLLNKLNVKKISWSKDNEDYYNGSTGLALEPLDMTKIGNLLINNGNWNGKQIISSEWIDKILKSKNFVKESWSKLSGIYYSYLWWIAELKNYYCCFAWGYGGQFIFVFPELNSVVVTTSKWKINAETAFDTETKIIELLSEHIIPLLETH